MQKPVLFSDKHRIWCRFSHRCKTRTVLRTVLMRITNLWIQQCEFKITKSINSIQSVLQMKTQQKRTETDWIKDRFSTNQNRMWFSMKSMSRMAACSRIHSDDFITVSPVSLNGAVRRHNNGARGEWFNIDNLQNNHVRVATVDFLGGEDFGDFRLGCIIVIDRRSSCLCRNVRQANGVGTNFQCCVVFHLTVL